MKALEEIKARLAAMEPGQWEVVEDEQTVRTADGEIMFDRSCEGRSYWNAHGRRSAEFIAHAPETQAKLIAALEAVEALAKRWGEEYASNPSEENNTRDWARYDMEEAITEALA